MSESVDFTDIRVLDSSAPSLFYAAGGGKVFFEIDRADHHSFDDMSYRDLKVLQTLIRCAKRAVDDALEALT